MPATPLTRRSILAQAWPIMLGQTTVPLVGLVDTAVIGRTGDAAALAGVALGATIINFLFWAFGFLRMGMTGMTAQAAGADDPAEMEAMLWRGLGLGVVIGAALFVLQIVLIPIAFALLAGGKGVDASAHAFVAARFFGAPAALGVFAINGWLIGLGRTRAALMLQIVMNAANIALDLVFVWHFELGARGVGIGTSCAEWIALITGLAIAIGPHGAAMIGRIEAARLLDRIAIKRLIAVNGDIMIRTLALLLLFGWFTNAGARLGAGSLAANQVLMQFVSVSAFVLDGFAFTAEARVGAAIGARSPAELRRAIRLTGEFCLATGLAFALAFLIVGRPAIDWLTSNTEVRAIAAAMLPFTAIVPLIGAPAWLLDGIFIGATGGRALRNAALIATGLYIATDLALRPHGEAGLWWALTLSYVFRALALGAFLPGLLRSVDLAQGRPAT